MNQPVAWGWRLAALRRAAEMARTTAIQTGTGIVISRDGKPVHFSAAQLRANKP